MNITDVVSGLDEILLVLNGKYDTLLEEKSEKEDDGEDASEYNYQILEVEDKMEKIEEAKDILTWELI